LQPTKTFTEHTSDHFALALDHFALV